MEYEKRAVLRSMLLEKTVYMVYKGGEVHEVREVRLFIPRGTCPIVHLTTARKLIVLSLEKFFMNNHTFAIYDAPNKAPLGWIWTLYSLRCSPMGVEISL